MDEKTLEFQIQFLEEAIGACLSPSNRTKVGELLDEVYHRGFQAGQTDGINIGTAKRS